MIIDTCLSSQNKKKKIIIAVKVNINKHASGKLKKNFASWQI